LHAITTVGAEAPTGDPSLSAIHEQMQALAEAGVPFEVIPGISASAAAAKLKVELTVPGMVQTIILSALVVVPRCQREVVRVSLRLTLQCASVAWKMPRASC